MKRCYKGILGNSITFFKHNREEERGKKVKNKKMKINCRIHRGQQESAFLGSTHANDSLLMGLIMS